MLLIHPYAKKGQKKRIKKMNSFRVEETNLTFFECVSRFMHAHPLEYGALDARSIHDATLMYFASIVFENIAPYQGNLSLLIADIRKNNLKHLVLKRSGVFHAAVKQWITRFHSVEKSVAKSPEVWYLEYPKLMKGAFLRFIYYHKDYRSKPHRLFCKYVFAHLVVDQLNCRMYLVEAHRWFYPLDYGDYYIDATLNTLIIRQENSSFSLLTTERDDVLDVGISLCLQPIRSDDDNGIDVASLFE